MAPKIANIFDFLKGLLMGVWIGITIRPDKAEAIIAKVLRKRREADAEDAWNRSEIGFIPPGK
jgi:hypothetical protein